MELELEQHGVGRAKARGENHPRGQNRACAVPVEDARKRPGGPNGDYATSDFAPYSCSP